LVMKFDFEIKTEPNLRALVAIFIVAFCSASLASIAIYLDNPLTGIYCATVLAIIILWPFSSTLVDRILPRAGHCHCDCPPPSCPWIQKKLSPLRPTAATWGELWGVPLLLFVWGVRWGGFIHPLHLALSISALLSTHEASVVPCPAPTLRENCPPARF
jgi:hypothetical protein